ncbi:hypothetical protein [Phytomonospora endophytica]|uniref:WD40 repeat domain-containing protein n=1 Tax=Phytomonospora endophytica TaxID=714109 RepID=A0A841FJT5_9ACTN|nr:hypothetical protein [Phytomonospora endophytica]MBB6037581.1 hypothetical protein [Phytomonospora endophytica]GIG67893.1 hypothetical protein Pen01_41880 [Phytomonospora endophytica]
MRRLPLAGALLALLTACTPGAGDPPGGDAGPGGSYAYLKVAFGESWLDTKSTLVVMDGTKRIGSTELLLGTTPLFTVDGRFAFTAATIGDSVTAISTETGAVSTVTCEDCGDTDMSCLCQMVVPVGGSTIAWLNKEGRLVTADLAANPPVPVETGTVVPLEDGFLDAKLYPALLAGRDGVALAAYPTNDRPVDEPTPAYLVTSGEEPRRLDVDRPDALEIAAFSPDGTGIAVGGEREYVCATLTLVDLGTGESVTSPLRAAPDATCETHDAFVDELWWDHDGTLNVYYEESTEGQGGDDVHARFDGTRWAPAGVDLNRQTHPLASGASVVLDDWSLSLTGDGTSVAVDTEVRHVVAAPA